jgi:hypothetical protein
MTNRSLTLRLAIACALVAAASTADAAYRQYYTAWTHYPAGNYHYRTLYYKPSANYSGYNYHYTIYKPETPRYVYFYNPHKGLYWGRYDIQGKPGAEYSLLADKDRKHKLADIPESAFPTPGKMPVIPESTDGVTLDPPKDLPKED